MLMFGQVVLQILQQGGETSPLGDKFFQGGLLLIFVSFALALYKLESAERSKRDSAWQTYMETQSKQFNSAMTDQAALLTGAIDREREQRKEVMGQAYREFSGNMDRIAGGLGELTKAIGIHDDSAEGRHQRILDAIRTINGKTAR